ncbi:hypothetical protein [Nocardia abscessus]|uniref:hypothetical protein n=1 Tax=Nocardia abscessus TaxID=120957 RepID=UPI0024547D20|nr:hypothetical protein [Nocardia abscessus]
MPDDEFRARRFLRADELRSRLAHDNPHWAVSTPDNAMQALEIALRLRLSVLHDARRGGDSQP